MEFSHVAFGGADALDMACLFWSFWVVSHMRWNCTSFGREKRKTCLGWTVILVFGKEEVYVRRDDTPEEGETFIHRAPSKAESRYDVCIAGFWKVQTHST